MVQLKKFYPLIISLLFIGMVRTTVSIVKNLGYHITFSSTKSMPRGLYLVIPAKKFSPQEIVEFTPPNNTLTFLKNKNWIPKSGRMIKYVFAVPNDKVCISGSSIWVNNNKIASVHKYYDKNKLLPQTKFCGKLNTDEYLLLSTQNKRSFDGRYFGITPAKKILGKAIPLFNIHDT